MHPDEFYDNLPTHFWKKLDGFYEMENIRERGDWERTRWSTCLLLNIQLSKGKSLKPQDLGKFEWEKDTTKIDFEDFKNKAELYKKRIEHGK